MRERIDLYTILPLPILCGIHCNNGVSVGNIILRNTVGDDGLGWVASTKGGCAENGTDSCTQA